MLRNLQSRAERAHFSPMRTALVLLASLLVACSTSNSITPESYASATEADAVTIEDLLRWPLEGHAGADTASSKLRSRFALKPLAAGEFSGQGPFLLDDGYVLSFASVSPTTRDIDLGLTESPCYSPAAAAATTGAVPSKVTQDAHGEDRGMTYDVQRNGMRVRFTTTPLSYRCVVSIHVHTSRVPKP